MKHIAGTGITFGGIYVSMQQVEVWMQIASLTVGIIAGLLTIWSILRKWNK